MTLKRDGWEKLVEQWRGSRQTARQFAAARGVTESALRYWANRLADEEDEEMPVGRAASERARTASAPRLARVVAPGVAAAPSAGRIMVVIGKASIVVERGFDDAHLRDVVRALSEVG